jgi:hypothetical protein
MALKDPSQIKLLKRRNKYGAKKCLMNGIKFDSEAEAARYVELFTDESVIPGGDLQRPYKFKCGVIYKLDFAYIKHGKIVYEDVKGYETREFKIKKKLMKSEYGIDVQIVKMPQDKVERLLAIGRAMFGEM